MNKHQINIEDYNYDLPESRIAQYPLEQRDRSKLLICSNGKISEDVFSSISNYLPDNSLVIFNDTKVIHARLLFKKETGSEIEIFCLEPVLPSADFQLAFASNSGVVWCCLVGNNKKWKQGKLFFKNERFTLAAEKLEQSGDSFRIRFEWEPADSSFASVMESIGKIPLPPYITRNADEKDNMRYQTVYAHYEGSVAAPTAGLHFTGEVLDSLKKKDIKTSFVTLHVGAGTFKPVGSKNISDHNMHIEIFSVKKKLIEQILQNQGLIVAVGTTTVRTLESLYWAGKKILGNKKDPLSIDQWEPYSSGDIDFSVEESLNALLDYCNKNNVDHIDGNTRLMIVPGYRYKIVNEMITNFHQPKSTLLLLVSAFIGDAWKSVYKYAMENNFRFLSYGDVCYFKP
jgi:S-adenosylmethionine:tRNA ribosyltransferase-isomerase